MRSIQKFVFCSALALCASSARAADDTDTTDALIDSVSIHETQFDLVPASEAKNLPPPSDDIVTAKVPLLQSEPEAHAYLAPFIGRSVYPFVSASLDTAFVRETFEKDTTDTGAPRGNMALASRLNLSLWIADLRFPASTSGVDQPMQLAIKIPFSAYAHRFAPTFVVHLPVRGGFDQAVYEAGLAYQIAYGRFSLKLEASAFNGTFERTKGEQSGGMVGWDASIGALLTDQLAAIVEADGVTAISERVGITLPRIGDTVVHLYPGLRWFPKEDTRLFVGAAAVISVVPEPYDLLRRRGAMFELGYTFL